MRRMLLAAATALGAIAASAASETVTYSAKALPGVSLDTRTAAGAARNLTYGDGLLPIACAGWYGDSGSGTRWTLSKSVDGGASETLATGRADTPYAWSPDAVGTTVLTLTAADGSTRTATFKADVYYIKGDAAQELDAPTSGETVTTTLTLGGVALDTRTAAGATRTLTKGSSLLPLSLAGWYGTSGAGSNWSLSGSLDGASGAAISSGSSDALLDWTPEVGTTVLTLTAADSTTLTAKFATDKYFGGGVEELTPGSASETVSVTLVKGGVALDTRTSGATRTLSTADEILPISWSGDNWVGASASAAATVTVTAPAGTSTDSAKTGEGAFELGADSIGTWTLRHVAGGKTANATIVLKVDGGGTTAFPYALTASTGFVDGLKAGDYVTVPAAAYADVSTQAKEDHFVLVPRGSQHLVLSDATKFTATWLNDDGTVADTTETTVYDTPAHDAIAKASDAQYDYTFAAWSPAPEAIVSNTTYTATYDKAVRSYAVKFVDEDGTTVLDSQTLDYGATPVYGGNTPAKASTAQYSYAFDGWTPAIATVTGVATYKAVYKATVRSYTITWQDYAGETIDTTTVAYGEMPAHADASRAATPEYSYPFTGWTPALAKVTGAATYKATHGQTANSYTLAWMLGDGTVYQSASVPYGTAIAAPADPDRGEWYVFKGWDKAAPATMPAEDVTITAIWEKLGKLVYSAQTGDDVALDTRVAAGKPREIASAADILPIAASGTGFRSASGTGAWTVEAEHGGKAEKIGEGAAEGTFAWTPTYSGTNTLTLTAAKSATLTQTAVFVLAEEAAEVVDEGAIGGESGNEAGSVTVKFAKVALDTRVAAGALRTVESAAEVLPFTLSGDGFAGADASAAYAVTLAVNGGAATEWTSGTGDAVKEWAVDTAGTNVFTHVAADGAKMLARFEVSSRIASGGAADEIEPPEEGSSGTTSVTVRFAGIALDTRDTEADNTRTVESQADILPIAWSGDNWAGADAAASVTLTYTAPSGAKTVKELSGEGTAEFVIGAAGTWTLTHVAGGVTRTARFVIAAEDGIPYVSTDAELEAACADDALVEIAVDEKGDEVELTIPAGYRLAATDTEGVYRMEVWYESDGTALRTSGGASWIDAGAADAVKIDAFESLDGAAGWDVTFKVALKDGLDFTTWFLQSALHEKVTVHMSDTLAALGTASDAVLAAAAEDVVGDPEARTVTVRFALEDATAKAAFFRIVVED